MNFDSEVDGILELYKDGKPHHIYFIMGPRLNQQDDKVVFVDYLIEKDLIKATGHHDHQYRITTFGLSIINKEGGWIKYLEKRDGELEQEEADKAKEAADRV